MAPSRARRRGTLSAFRRPVVTDLVFWIALAMAIVLGLAVAGLLVAVVGVPDSAVSWAVPVVAGVLFAYIGLKFLAMGINISRALQPDEAPAPSSGVGLESTGRAAGAVLGRGARALSRGRGAKGADGAKGPSGPTTPAPSPRPPTSPASGGPAPRPAPSRPPATPAPAPAPDVTVDKAAKVLGSMVGRRLGERRRDS